ncbi:hypothetical protein RSOL_201630, partial [Rhizoctonia solani AG-3 Rhs1AP]
MVGLKVSVMLVVCTYMAVGAPITKDGTALATSNAPQCTWRQFTWKNECLPYGGRLSWGPKTPKGTECPEHYQYYSDGSCKPRLPSKDEPKCDDHDLVLNKDTLICEPKPDPVAIGV